MYRFKNSFSADRHDVFQYMFIKDTGKRNIYVYFSDLMMPSLIKYAIEFKYMHQHGDISLYGLT